VTRRRSSRSAAAVRVAFGLGASVLVLGLILRFIARGSAAPSLRAFEPRWALGAVCLLTLQVALVALRWAFFARELAAPLGYSAALGAYYVSVFLNQLLPLGMLGDAVRGAWHARRLASCSTAERSSRPALVAATALILDRASGQLVLCLLVLAVLPWWWQPVREAWGSGHELSPLAILGSLVGVLVLAVLAWYFGRSALQRTARVRQVFLRPGGLVVHGTYSAVALLVHLLAFFCAARALGFSLPFGLALRVVPPVLAASSLPSFALGTGAREAAAAGLYHLLGLRAADGAAIALALGLLGFVASLPALLVLLSARLRSHRSG
jgi:glycosyltransferase 2 family protein